MDPRVAKKNRVYENEAFQFRTNLVDGKSLRRSLTRHHSPPPNPVARARASAIPTIAAKSEAQ